MAGVICVGAACATVVVMVVVGIVEAKSGGVVVHGANGSGSISNPSGERTMKYQDNRSVGAIGSFAAASALALAGDVCAQQAVQWRVEDGGNGHWYSIRPPDLFWAGTQQEAEGLGGHLATIGSSAEMQFVLELPGFDAGLVAWIGFYRDGGYGAPWRWVTGEPFDFTPWAASQPCPCNGSCNCATEWAGMLRKETPWWGTGFGDSESPCCGGGPIAVFEYSADCNGDGIVDYGQILSGQFTDTNANGIPDICEVDPCPGDAVLTGTVDAVDIAAMLGAWGTSGGDYPRADINHDGIVAADDLGSLLAGWGACP